jgi:hypothetical protein
MRVADEIRFDNPPLERSFDGLIMISYVVFSSIFLVAIYFASTSAGTSPGEFVSMVAFP